MHQVTTAGSFWDQEVIQPTHVSWMANPLVREYINRSISGTQDGLWPFDWFVQRVGPVRFERALSIGCGSGPLERDLIKRDLCVSIDAFDGSLFSLMQAQKAAQAEGMQNRIRYFAADFNEPVLPHDTYDIVFFHQSIHHVAKLEKLFRAVLLALKPGGLLYLDEYIGPSRTDWNDELVQPHRSVYNELPPEMRLHANLPLPIQPDDPSEAIRSSEIVTQLRLGFDIVERRDYGGNLLSVLFPAINWNAATPDVVARLIEEERGWLKSGTSESFHAVIVAQPKSGIARTFAGVRYFLEPKAVRVLREVKARFRLQ